MRLFGIGFDAASVGPWAVAIGLWVVGGWFFNIARHRVSQAYGEIQAEFLEARA